MFLDDGDGGTNGDGNVDDDGVFNVNGDGGCDCDIAFDATDDGDGDVDGRRRCRCSGMFGTEWIYSARWLS